MTKLSDYIEALGEILAEHGDLPVVTSEEVYPMVNHLPRILNSWKLPGSIRYVDQYGELEITEMPRRVLL